MAPRTRARFSSFSGTIIESGKETQIVPAGLRPVHIGKVQGLQILHMRMLVLRSKGRSSGALSLNTSCQRFQFIIFICCVFCSTSRSHLKGSEAQPRCVSAQRCHFCM